VIDIGDPYGGEGIKKVFLREKNWKMGWFKFWRLVKVGIPTFLEVVES
jgi:hypothetical protein